MRWLAQHHPGCNKALREVLSTVTERFLMLLEDEHDNEIARFLFNNLGHVSAVQLYVNADSLAQQCADVKEYMGTPVNFYALDAILAAIIYNTSLADLESYILIVL